MSGLQQTKTEQAAIPVHQWTGDDGRVWVVKCADKDGRGYDGFQYPESGSVKPLKCSTYPDCNSGGLFGWAWGIGFGVGKAPDYSGIWLVLSAPKEQIIAIDGLGGKVKIAAATPAEVDAMIVYRGDAFGAISKTHTQRSAWISHFALNGNAAASGWNGNAAASGWNGNAAASGWNGNAAASGWNGNAAASGESGNAAASGESGNAAASGENGNAAASGWNGNAAASGWNGNAAASGWNGNAAASGWNGNAAASGERGIAALSGEKGTIEVGPDSLGAVTANNWTWKSHAGAVVICRWKAGDIWQHKVFVGEKDETLRISSGTVIQP